MWPVNERTKVLIWTGCKQVKLYNFLFNKNLFSAYAMFPMDPGVVSSSSDVSRGWLSHLVLAKFQPFSFGLWKLHTFRRLEKTIAVKLMTTILFTLSRWRFNLWNTTRKILSFTVKSLWNMVQKKLLSHFLFMEENFRVHEMLILLCETRESWSCADLTFQGISKNILVYFYITACWWRSGELLTLMLSLESLWPP